MIFLAGCEFPPGINNYRANAEDLRRDLGFSHGSPYIMVNGKAQEVFMLKGIVKGKPFNLAGIEGGEIVVSHQILKFYLDLEASRGSTFNFWIVDGGDGIPLKKRIRRKITITVPSK